MASANHSNSAIVQTSASGVLANDVSSSRRPVWIAAFALFSVTMFVVSPGATAVAGLSLGLSAFYVLIAEMWPDKVGTGSKVYPLAGALLTAVLLWVSILVGADITAYLGVSTGANLIIASSLISFIIFPILIVGEFALAIALQLFISRNNDVPLRVAIALNSKYAGLFGELR